MQTETKDFLKEAFGSKKRSPVERRTSGGDGSKEDPFVLIRQEINDYVGDEYSILNYLYGQYKLLGQRLMNNNDKSIDELDIEMTHGEIITVYFDLTAVF